jgi:hypothetical protein
MVGLQLQVAGYDRPFGTGSTLDMLNYVEFVENQANRGHPSLDVSGPNPQNQKSLR